jgi:hypothetical protein
MARRESVYVVKRVPADGGEPPNRYIPEITVEIRVHFPPDVNRDKVLKAITDAWADGVEKIQPEYVCSKCGAISYDPGDIGENHCWLCCDDGAGAS